MERSLGSAAVDYHNNNNNDNNSHEKNKNKNKKKKNSNKCESICVLFRGLGLGPLAGGSSLLAPPKP